MKPIVAAFEEDDSSELSEQWKVIKIVHMKGNENEDWTYQPKTKFPNINNP